MPPSSNSVPEIITPPVGGEEVYLSDEFLANPVNPGAYIQGFLNDPANYSKNIIFPTGTAFELEQPIYVHDAQNQYINFNGCTFTIPDDADVSNYPGYVLLTFNKCTNSIMENLIIDGNKNNTSWIDEYGIYIVRSNGMLVRNFLCKEIFHHGIWVGLQTHDITFYDCTVQNTYGFVSAAEIYVEANVDDDVEFHNTTILRDQYISNQGFYCNSAGSIIIDGVTATDIAGFVIDVRRGTVNIKHVTATHCGGLLVSQSSGQGTIIADSMTGTNMVGRSGVEAIIYILDTKSATISNVTATCTGLRNYYGIRIREEYTESVHNVSLSNIQIDGYTIYGILMAALTDSVHFDTIKLNPKEVTELLVRCETNVTVPQYINNMTSDVGNGGNYDPNGMLVIT